jgi:hypothetical protein
MRDSCITHPARQPVAIVRQDYYLLMGRDAVAAALLNIFEYWANGAISKNPHDLNPWIGVHPIYEFEELMVGIATDKQIRKRLHILQEMNFIEVRQPVKHRKSFDYKFNIETVQNALDALKANGQMTAEPTVKQPQGERSNDRRVNGQMTAEPTVKQPQGERSNDRMTIYKKDQEENKREVKREEPPTPEAEVLTPKPINPETQESALEQTCLPGNQNPKSSLPTDNSSLGQKSPAPLANTETTADRVRRVYQETGFLPRIPAELEAWVQIDLGTEIVSSYRKSGRITTIRQGDIQPAFASYVASQWKGKDIDYGYNYIRTLEKDPTKWETLGALVIKWQASISTNNHNLNITQEVERASKPKIDFSGVRL